MKYHNYIKGFMILGLAALAACKTSNDVVPTVTTTSFTVFNATDSPINLYLNGTRQNSSGGIYTGSTTGYLSVPQGAQTYSFKHNFNNQDLTNTDTLFTIPLNLPAVKPDTNTTTKLVTSYKYSLFVAGTTRSKTFLVKDSLVTNTSSLPEIRFVHAAPGVGALKVFLNDTLRFTSNAYGAVSAFKVLTSSKDEVVKVYDVSTNTLKYTTTVTNLVAQGVYTLFAVGSFSGTGSGAFKTGLFKNQ